MITPEELRRVRFVLGGMTREQAQALVGVSRRQWTRYETGESRIPKSVYELLRIIAAGFLPPTAGDAWHGWSFFRGELYSPEGNGFRPGDVRAIPYLWMQVDEYRRKTGQAPTHREALKGKTIYLPRAADKLTRV